MTKRIGILIIAVAVFLVGELIYSVYRWKEPSYQGIRLKAWLISYERRGGADEADEAVRHMGTRCLPFLMEMLNARDGRGRETLADVTEQLGIKSSQYYPAAQQHRWALGGLRALGPAAAPVVPELVKLLKSPETQRDACLALGAIGSPSMKPLVKALNAEDPVTRAGAVSALGECFAPSLGNDRNDAELEAIRVEGRVVLPPILQCLGDEDSGVRLSALNALGGIELEQETIVQSVARSLGDSNPAVRRAATIALARHRDAATAQVPLLVEKLKDPDHSVAEGAAFAIRLIVPDKAEELGAR